MIDPVLDPDDQEGRAVEREALEAHQRQYGVRPLTGLPSLPASQIRTLVTLQKAISLFLSDEQDTSQQQSPGKRARLSEAADAPRPPALAAQGPFSCGDAFTPTPRPVLNLVECEVPAPFFCPLSRCVMSDPVVDRRDPGASMERAAVEAHLAQYGTNPLTGEVMAAGDLIPDKGLRSAINRWLAKHAAGAPVMLHISTAAAAGGPEDGAHQTLTTHTWAAAGAGAAGGAGGVPTAPQVDAGAQQREMVLAVPSAAALSAAAAEDGAADAAAGPSRQQPPLPPAPQQQHHHQQHHQQQQQQPRVPRAQQSPRPPLPTARRRATSDAGTAGAAALPSCIAGTVFNAGTNTHTINLEALTSQGAAPPPCTGGLQPSSLPPQAGRLLSPPADGRKLLQPHGRRASLPSLPGSAAPEHVAPAAVRENPKAAAPGRPTATERLGQAQAYVKVEADAAAGPAQLGAAGIPGHGGVTGPLPGLAMRDASPPPATQTVNVDAVAGGYSGAGAHADAAIHRAGIEAMDLVSSDSSDDGSRGGPTEAAAADGGGAGSSGQTSLVPLQSADVPAADAEEASGGAGAGDARRSGASRGRPSLLRGAVPLAAARAAAATDTGRGPAADGWPSGAEAAEATAAAVEAGAAAAGTSGGNSAERGAPGSGLGEDVGEEDSGGSGDGDEAEADGTWLPTARDGLVEAGSAAGRTTRISYYTDEELEALVAGVEECGCRWNLIKARSSCLDKRSESALCQKWMSLAKAAGSGWRAGRPDNVPLGLRVRISALAGARDAAATEPDGAPLPAPQGEQSGPRAANRYTDQEMEALVDGILKHGFRWKVIFAENRAVLGSRNQCTVKYKWKSLRNWAASGWVRKQGQELPPETLRRKVEAAIKGGLQGASPAGGASPRRPPRPWNLPILVPAHVAREVLDSPRGGDAVTVQVRVQVQLDGAVQSVTHSATLRAIASGCRYMLTYCASLRNVLIGKRIVAWRCSPAAEADLLVQLASAPSSSSPATRLDAAVAGGSGAGAVGENGATDGREVGEDESDVDESDIDEEEDYSGDDGDDGVSDDDAGHGGDGYAAAEAGGVGGGVDGGVGVSYSSGDDGQDGAFGGQENSNGDDCGDKQEGGVVEGEGLGGSAPVAGAGPAD